MPRLSLRDQITWIRAHWRPYRKVILGLIALTLANAAVVVVHPLFLKRVVDGIESSAGWRALMPNLAGLFLFGVAQLAIYITLQIVRMRVNQGLDYGIRLRAFEHILRLGDRFTARFRTGDVVTRLTDDVSEKLAWYLCSGVFRMLEAASVITFGIIMMLLLSPKLTLAAAGPLPVLIGIYLLLDPRLRRCYQEVQRSISGVNEVLESAFSGMRVIKGFAVEPLYRRRASDAFSEQRRAEIRSVRYQTVMDSLYGEIWQLAIVVVLLVGGAMVIRNEITLGELVAFDAYVLLLVFPMLDLGVFLVRGRVSSVSIERLGEIEGMPPEVYAPERTALVARTVDDSPTTDHEPPEADRPRLPVAFREVSFGYSGSEHQSLVQMTLDAKPGHLTALVGEIGSGKSTALRLVPRLSDPEAGSITVGDRNLKDWNLVELRRRLGYVPQEAQLFSTTVRENIRFGRDWVSDADVAMAAEAAGLQRDLGAWPQGLETTVGSQGIRLSGGQKQRVSLARALAGKPSVLLLDDCTSALDAETEDRVWEAILRELPGCTTLVVTHRPATLRRAETIVVLDQGHVVERGTFRELNQDGTRFHDLYVKWEQEES